MGESRGGGRGSGPPPPPPEKSQKIRVSKQYWSRSPEKSQSYQASIQCWAIIDPPASDITFWICAYLLSLSDDKQADVIDAFNTTSRYLDDILIINNVYFDNMVSQIYPSELQLNKAKTSDTKAAFLDFHLSISNDIVSTKIYDKRDDFDFEIVNFPF